MNIECILKREGGTKVDIGGTDYHFAPIADGRHVAFVENQIHMARFLSIPEAYRLAVDLAAQQAQQAQQAPQSATPISESTITSAPPRPITAIAPSAPAAPVVQAAPIVPVVPVEQTGAGNEESDDGEPVEDKSELRALLAAQYKEKFGKAPHGKWTAEKIEAALQGEAQ
ncbi:hypothetical protein [Caballeronia zhejiangensis]|uniref:Uncharacterized protein n=1 Tax=Caballeronia zhejiangensis TaxID=871203 RepID=A0A656QB02_9BURK|nr:hypothetical protein [Caballeronia zhejiangensis]KDR26000.1 hypothetical protein BG60_26460 [Caballeronia zhejiangensis]